MRLLLDTNVFLWAANVPERLGAVASVLDDVHNQLILSAVTSWEIAIKSGLGRLPLPEPAATWVPRHARTLGCSMVAIEHDHAVMVEQLPRHHGDPFDRLLVAQALSLKVPLVTADVALRAYGIEVVEAG